MRYGSACSGMEAAHLAWAPLGWVTAWVAEVDAAPCALLAYRLPEVPNLGDMTTIPERVRSGEVEAPEVFIAGTPCQSFSVAGARRSLADARGNLALTYCEIVNAIDDVRRARCEQECIAVWENVPGVLSTRDNAFGCFLGELSGEECALLPPGDRWPDAGVVVGPKRTLAWRILDAQYFGLAQRRRRVFVVASARDGFDPFAVLFESEGVQRHSAPRREAGEGIAAGAETRAVGGGAACPATTGTLALGGRGRAYPGTSAQDAGEGFLIAMAHGQGNAEIAQDGGAPTLTCNHEAPIVALPETTHTLRADGFDASEDGTGRGTPLVPVHVDPVAPTLTSGPMSEASHGKKSDTDREALIAFSCKDHGADAGDIAPTLRSMGHDGSHAHAGGQVAVAIALRGREGGATAEMGDDCGHALRASQGGGDKPHVLTGMAVRRLTPRECERLQGAEDDWTLVPNDKGKPMADGPRYKMLGNSFAVPVIQWIGRQIERAHRYALKAAA